jgi:hypothetical protein
VVDSRSAEGRALALLHAHGAEAVAHPGGTLLAHLQRVRHRLADWGARPALRLAGLCHAFYGTDGFPTALIPPDRPDGRAELAEAIGAEAEALVYLYASCDRTASYPALTEAGGAFHDRFTGRSHTPDLPSRRDFAELTAANELDLARIDPAFRERHGAGLLALFTGFRELLSAPARSELCVVLGPPPR